MAASLMPSSVPSPERPPAEPGSWLRLDGRVEANEDVQRVDDQYSRSASQLMGSPAKSLRMAETAKGPMSPKMKTLTDPELLLSPLSPDMASLASQSDGNIDGLNPEDSRSVPMPFWHGTNGRDGGGRPQSVTLAVDINGLLMLYLRGVDQVLAISRMSIATYNSNICQIVFYSGSIPTCEEYSIIVPRLDYDLIALRDFLKSNHAINHDNMWTWPVVFSYASLPSIDTSWVLDTVNYDRPCLRWNVSKPRPVLSFWVGDAFHEQCTITMKLMDRQDMVSLSVPVAVAEYMMSHSTFGKQMDFVCGNTTGQVTTELGPGDMAILALKFS